ncbi:MAG: hypothetical protein J5747_05255 [Spirochaetaceae bacterium]|nr:hypothetical protein [Spirochaetaceae bacterium]
MKSVKEMINLILKAVGLAMGVAVTVLSIINKAEASSSFILVGIGLTCIGISQFTAKCE